eukprot:TRINITY_DN33580_c0_g1_i1.p1 TRINITY_DN33580_c0_g1~~TRINITY_DN33580_c0_g1_i1.p1  ORF type:complete len:890 (-),score=121.58 TRINITY_DN33580_c0_g1_i1:85-2754(-)
MAAGEDKFRAFLTQELEELQQRILAALSGGLGTTLMQRMNCSYTISSEPGGKPLSSKKESQWNKVPGLVKRMRSDAEAPKEASEFQVASRSESLPTVMRLGSLDAKSLEPATVFRPTIEHQGRGSAEFAASTVPASLPLPLRTEKHPFAERPARNFASILPGTPQEEEEIAVAEPPSSPRSLGPSSFGSSLKPPAKALERQPEAREPGDAEGSVPDEAERERPIDTPDSPMSSVNGISGIVGSAGMAVKASRRRHSISCKSILVPDSSRSVNLRRSISGVSGVSGLMAAPSAESRALDAVESHEHAVFDPHEVWACNLELVMERYAMLVSTQPLDNLVEQKAMLKRANSMDSALFAGDKTACRTRFISEPSAYWRVAWDMGIIIFTCYDMLVVPLQIFEIPQTFALYVAQIVSLLFWTCDIPLSFLVGFHKLGSVEMRPSEIAKNYLRTWFGFDVSLVMTDLVMLVTEDLGRQADTAGLVRLAKTSRAFRIIRSVRLVRTFRLPVLFAKLEVWIESEVTKSILGIAKLVLSIVILNHFCACIWYGVGSAGASVGEDNWITSFDVIDKSFEYRYLTSMHWSVTQFTPAGMEISPRSTAERLYSIIVILFAMVCFSSFVSSITNTMNHLRSLNGNTERKFAALSRYFGQHNISLGLRLRVQRYIWHVLSQQRNHIQEKDVELLGTLTSQLRQELSMEVYSRDLEVHPVLKFIERNHIHTIQRICSSCVGQALLPKGDVLFTNADHATRMVIVKTGAIAYDHSLSALRVRQGKGTWLCEAALWTRWTTRGEAKGIEEGSLLVTIDAEIFKAECAKNIRARSYLRVYAALFVMHMNSCSLMDVSDINSPEFDIDRANEVASVPAYSTIDVDDKESDQEASAQGPNQGSDDDIG